MSRANILVVDDEPDICNMVSEILADEGYDVAVAKNGNDARQARRSKRPDLVLLDIWMPDVDGITLLKEWSEIDGPASPIVMMSGHGTVETAVEATRLGAYEFLEKPLSMAKLLLTVKRALEADRLNKDNFRLRHHPSENLRLIGKSPVIQTLKKQARKIAEHNTSVLIIGEPGSGKETLARYIHTCSTNRNGRFIKTSFTSMTPDETATELFGIEEGKKIRYGLIEQANRGTIFFDDIINLDFSIQELLVEALARRAFIRKKGTEPVKFDARIIASAPPDTDQMVKNRQFREDLYYSLNIVPFRTPPLRERSDDIPELLNYYTEMYTEREKLPYKPFTMAAQNQLRNYPWPGNIRELMNIIQRLLILSPNDSIDEAEIEAALGQESSLAKNNNDPVYHLPLRDAREKFEKAYFENRLRETNGNLTKLAKLAGIERTHLYRKLKALNISPKK